MTVPSSFDSTHEPHRQVSPVGEPHRTAEPHRKEVAMDLQGKGILITGASRGLGAALARELARRGARLILVARGEQALEEVAAAIRAAGGEAHAIAADVGAKDEVYPIAGAAASLLGDVEVVVHNASELGPVPLQLLADTACEDLEHVFAVNLVGPFRLTKALAGPMLLR